MKKKKDRSKPGSKKGDKEDKGRSRECLVLANLWSTNNLEEGKDLRYSPPQRGNELAS